MSGRSPFRFAPSLEQLGDRLNPGALSAAGALPDATRHEWVFGVELPAAGSEARVSTFPAVGRGSPGSDGVVILFSSLPGEGSSRSLNSGALLDPPDAADATRHVRHRMFALVDRSQLSEDGPGGEAGKVALWAEVDESGDRVGPFYTFKANTLTPVDVGADEVITIGGNRTETRAPDGGSGAVLTF